MAGKNNIKISKYLKKYYGINEDTPYIIEVIDAREVLINQRFDLGAKLYYIQSKMEQKNEKLAQELYDAHIQAFQDGIVQEAGNVKKEGLLCYRETFEGLIKKFAANRFDKEREWIPMDKFGQILDGAHRVACAIYFNVPIKVIRLTEIKGHAFDYRFFQKRGLEQGYLELMAATICRFKRNAFCVCVQDIKNKSLTFHNLYTLLYKQRIIVNHVKADVYIYLGKGDISDNTNSLIDIEKYLKINQYEENQEILISTKEKIKVGIVRWVRNKYTRILIWTKRKIGLPT